MVMYGVPAQVIVKQTRGLPPLYPINVVYRLLPCFGLIGFACTFNAFTPQYVRLPERLKNYAFTYRHPLEKQLDAAEKAKQAALKGTDPDDD
mmetsp:Transcript_59341/g.72595  ORF Transcript_59341/g.72595 Transcript_59341/m.72595 type:complete len:92 (-) Transcript_59341:209-484(-)